MPIPLKCLRELTLTAPLGHRPFLSAAGGLTGFGESLFVAADDELSLGIFPAFSTEPGRLFPVFAGALPAAPEKRKERKPDLEALALLHPALYPPRGALLALPSGSTPRRVTGALLPFGQQPEVPALSRPVDFGPLYQELLRTLPELNVEGAVPYKDSFLLFQRGNGSQAQNALIELSLASVLRCLRQGQALSAACLQRITPVELGNIRGSPLSFTDAALRGEEEIWFLAAAEATASTYADGAYKGSVLGRIQPDGAVAERFALDCPEKPEGLWFPGGNAKREFLVVTDADKPDTPASLYQGEIPGPPLPFPGES